MTGKALCDLGPDLETARTDVRPDDGPPHLPTRGIETGAQGRHDAGFGTPPPGVRHSDRIVGQHDDADTVGGEDRERKVWHLGEQPVRRAVVSRTRDVDHHRTMDLIDDRPVLGDAESGAQSAPGIEVGTEIAVSGFAEHGEAAGGHP
jgi:hypothetical protein